MANLILFLCFSFIMFEAGYYWREWSGRGETGRDAFGYTRDDSQRDSMIGKL